MHRRPHLMRSNSLILVDTKFRGKTMAYVPALCSLLQQNELRNVESSGPRSIILCPNSSSVEFTARLCNQLLHKPNRPISSVIHAIGTRQITATIVSIVLKEFRDDNKMRKKNNKFRSRQNFIPAATFS